MSRITNRPPPTPERAAKERLADRRREFALVLAKEITENLFADDEREQALKLFDYLSQPRKSEAH